MAAKGNVVLKVVKRGKASRGKQLKGLRSKDSVTKSVSAGKFTRKTKLIRNKAIKAASKKAKRPEVKVDVEALILGHRENGRKLARSLLRRWRVRMPAEEIDSIVDLTLCEAGNRYSPNHGASFMTFLFYHLRGNLVRAVATAAKSNHFMVAFARNAGIDVGDLAVPSEYSSHNIADYSAFEQQEVDLPEQTLLKQERIAICQKACSKLDALEREVLSRSYVNEEALIDIARELGYSRCHISRVKKRALDRLKEILGDFHERGNFQSSEEETVVTETVVEEAVEATQPPMRAEILPFTTKARRRRRKVFVTAFNPSEVMPAAVAA